MKECIKTIKSNISLRSEEFAFIAIFPTVVFIIGHIILRLILHFDTADDLTSFEFGTFLAIVCSFVMAFAKGSGAYKSHLSYGVSMGKRRRDIITANLIMAIIKWLIVSIFLFIFHTFENYVCVTTYKGIPLEFDFNLIFTSPFFITLIIVFTTLETFMGAMYIKFGNRTFWILYAITFFLLSIIPSFIGQAMDGTATGITATIGNFFIDIFNNISIDTIYLGICSICIILIILPYLILRKYRVSL